MNEAAIREKIIEVSEILDTKSTGTTSTTATAARKDSYLPESPAATDSAEAAVDHLRLQVKYLLFDLEATKRENRYLRQMLQRRNDGGYRKDD